MAISNRRIKAYADGKVTFKWKDYRENNRIKMMSLDVGEFIRRFLLHILRDNFYRIRYYGLLANRNRKAKLSRCRELLGAIASIESHEISSNKSDTLLVELCDLDIWRCPECQRGRMVRVKLLERITGVPPYRWELIRAGFCGTT